MNVIGMVLRQTAPYLMLQYPLLAMARQWNGWSRSMISNTTNEKAENAEKIGISFMEQQIELQAIKR